MTLKDEIRRLWTEAFADSPEWVANFFDRVYNDSDAVVLRRGDRIVSSLLLQRYQMLFHEVKVPMSYICGAATRSNVRGHGLMSRLMEAALQESYRRGDMFCSLIPARDGLYGFYRRFGFASVFLTDTERFTELHRFEPTRQFFPVEDIYEQHVYEGWHKLEMLHPGRVLHSLGDYLNCLDDNRLDEGSVAVMADADGEIMAVGWGVESDGVLLVKDILSTDEDARLAALGRLKSAFADLPVKVVRPAPMAERRPTTRAGMCRIVNFNDCFVAIARANSDWKIRIRVTDNLIEANNAVYEIAGGKVSVDREGKGKCDLDVDARVMTAIVFADRKIGEIMSVPSVRPSMALMLD